ncbi:MAG: T9SS type A sorting domain-containing protein [Bacteroidia bacterium]|nr:T9SS type A sorting domain-containing protein [Bacteroidia bacterium]
MKKITLSLLSIIGFATSFFGQAVVSVEAPEYDGGSFSAFIGANGTSTVSYYRACYLITQADLQRMALTNSVITSFGFDFYRPASTAVVGQFTLYLENTTDATYNKGTNYPTAIAPMSTNYTGIFTLPTGSQNSTATVNYNLTNNFNYTGGGIYVAFDYYCAAPNSTVFARYLGNSDLAVGGAHADAPAAGPAPTTLVTEQTRPVMRFNATNTATNEIGILGLKRPGLVSKLIGAAHPITALVRNNSANAINNLTVNLNITGANSHATTQVVPIIGPGGTVNVSFNSFIPTANGSNTIFVTVPSDQYTVNNSWGLTQSVTCGDYSNNPPITAATYSTGNYGYGSQAILATGFAAPATCSISGIKFAPSQQPQASYSVCGALLDAGGSLIAMTNTVFLSAANYGTFVNLNFAIPELLSAGSTYYYGIAQLSTGCYPFATAGVPATTNLNLYYTAPVAGGSIGNPQNQMGYVGMQAMLSYSNTYITADASRTVMCNNKGVIAEQREQVTLMATGVNGLTYNWVPGISATVTAPAIIVTPSITAIQGLINYTVTATDPASGCKSNQAVVTLSLQNCTGIPDNAGFGEALVTFPNPVVNGKTTVKGLEGKNTLTVFNVLGETVLTFESNTEETTVDLGNQPVGNYMLRVTNSANQSKIIKVIKSN